MRVVRILVKYAMYIIAGLLVGVTAIVVGIEMPGHPLYSVGAAYVIGALAASWLLYKSERSYERNWRTRSYY